MNDKETIGMVMASQVKFKSLLEGLKKIMLIHPDTYVGGEIAVLEMVVKELEVCGIE
jgi:hypothetical protein